MFSGGLTGGFLVLLLEDSGECVSGGGGASRALGGRCGGCYLWYIITGGKARAALVGAR